MEIFDISMMIERDMTVYKNRDQLRPFLEHTRKLEADGANESTLHMNTHTGTHMDAARHMLENGGTIEEIDLHRCLTPCRVLDFTAETKCISAKALQGKAIVKGDFVLLKTRNSCQEHFDFEFVYLESSGAEYLRDVGVVGVGIDCLSIERAQPGHDTHRTLLPEGIVILEGLRLADVEEGSYYLSALPLKLRGSDGSPVRAVLFRL